MTSRKQNKKRPGGFFRSLLRQRPPAIPESTALDADNLKHPGGAGWYIVCAVVFRQDSELVTRTGINVGVTCKEQVYTRTAGDNCIEMWPSSVVMIQTGAAKDYNLPDERITRRASVWAPVKDETASREASIDMELRRAERPVSTDETQ